MATDRKPSLDKITLAIQTITTKEIKCTNIYLLYPRMVPRTYNLMKRHQHQEIRTDKNYENHQNPNFIITSLLGLPQSPTSRHDSETRILYSSIGLPKRSKPPSAVTMKLGVGVLTEILNQRVRERGRWKEGEAGDNLTRSPLCSTMAGGW
jgi:hypothetical protein